MPAEEKVTRKLRDILSADVKSYSRMMGENEASTYQRLTVNLELIRFIISTALCHVFKRPLYIGGVPCEK